MLPAFRVKEREQRCRCSCAQCPLKRNADGYVSTVLDHDTIYDKLRFHREIEDADCLKGRLCNCKKRAQMVSFLGPRSTSVCYGTVELTAKAFDRQC